MRFHARFSSFRARFISLLALWALLLMTAPGGLESSAQAKGLSGQGSAGPTVGIRGSQFVVNGQPTFLLGVSYFDVKGWKASDLDFLRARGFNLIRVWLDWKQGLGSTFDADGDFVSSAVVKELVRAAGQRGMVVDVTVFHQRTPQANHERALSQVISVLGGEPNVIFDLVNEHERGWDHPYMARLVSLAKTSQPVFYSNSGTHFVSEGQPSPQVGNIQAESGSGVDLLAPHFPRTNDFAERVAQRVQVVRQHTDLPIYLQEEDRRGHRGPDPSAQQLITVATQGKAAGAAGYVFHTDAAFDLSGNRTLVEQLDDVERAVVDELAFLLGSSPQPAPPLEPQSDPEPPEAQPESVRAPGLERLLEPEPVPLRQPEPRALPEPPLEPLLVPDPEPSPEPRGVHVALQGDAFALNGTPTFLLGVSYFDVLGWTESDLDRLAARRFNLIRIWLDWKAPGRSTFDQEGNFIGSEVVRQLVRAAAARGMVVDVAILYRGSSFEREAIRQALSELGDEPNVIFDLVNEHNLADFANTEEELSLLVEAARAADEDSVVFASISGKRTMTRERVRLQSMRTVLDAGVDLIAPHLPRTKHWASRTAQRVEAFRDYLNSRGVEMPIYLQEENRRHWKGAEFLAEDFLMAASSAHEAGAAGWVFHTRAGFEMAESDFFANLDAVESIVVDQLGDAVFGPTESD